jgi:hypothetical protein
MGRKLAQVAALLVVGYQALKDRRWVNLFKALSYELRRSGEAPKFFEFFRQMLTRVITHPALQHAARLASRAKQA